MNGWGYGTPAIADGYVFVSAFDGGVRSLRAEDGQKRWETFVGGRILGSALVVGNLVFVSNLEKKTFALDRRTGKIVWRTDRGKYIPGIATNRFYYFSLNGSLVKYRPRPG
jgi:outer membrane protein assembly factor BamB